MSWVSRAVAVAFALLLAPSFAWAQCNLNNYPPPPGGGVITGNCTVAVNPVATDLLLGWQGGNTAGSRDRVFTLSQIQTYVLSGGTGGGPFLPLTGGTLTGSLNVGGATGLGTNSAVWVTATGGAQATLGTGGAGVNLTTNLRSKGTGFVQLGSDAFSAVQIQPAASNGGILTIAQPTTAGATNLIGISTSNATIGGLNFTSPTLVTRNWTYSGTAASSILNRPFSLNAVVGGNSANTDGYGINAINTTYTAFSTSFGARALQILSNLGAGSVMQPMVGASVRLSQTAQPATSTTLAWAPSTAYVIGNMVLNDKKAYWATVAGTSAGSGGPTGTGGAIVDGGVTWKYASVALYAQQQIGLDITNASSFNLGGTATGAVGANWAAVLGSHLLPAATFYSEANVLELDDNNEAAPRRSFTLGLVKVGVQGSVYDYGLSFAGSGGANTWRNPIMFRNAVDPNGVAIAAVDQGSGALQTMAGFMDLLSVDATGQNTQAGWTVQGGGGFLIRGPNSQWRGNGDFQIGNASLAISANALTIDTTYQLLTAFGALAGGNFWTTGDIAVDDFGNLAAVTAVAGVPTALNIAGRRKTYVDTASVPGGVVNWWPVHVGQFKDDTGGLIPIAGFTTATETYSVGTTLNFGTAAATIINIGRAASTTTITGTIKAGASTGVSCGPGAPTVGFTTVNGLVTAC